MKKYLFWILLLSFYQSAFAKNISIDNNKSKGIDQGVIVSLDPAPGFMEVDQNATIKAVFNVKLDERFVKKNDIKLKGIALCKRDMIKGVVKYNIDENSLSFTPNKLLEPGYYEVGFKMLKTAKHSKEKFIKKIEYRFYVPEVVNGYKLPPEPNERLNNSTLLGIDINENGIRDDVERWIINHYANDAKYSKTKTAIALQYAWASQKVLEAPTMESKKYLDDALDCQYYWFKTKQKSITDAMIEASDTNRTLFLELKTERTKWTNENKIFNDPILKDKIYNTRERIERKFSFNAALSGNIFDGREESIDNCKIDIDILGE